MIPQALQPTVQHSRASPAALRQQLVVRGVRHAYLDGGELIQSFLFENLLDRMTITTIPMLLGQGRRLWGRLPADQACALQAARHWDCGFVQSRYQRRR